MHDTRPSLHRLRAAHWLPVVLLPALLAATACGREPSAMVDSASPAGTAMQEATVRSGDVTIRASVVPTSAISEQVARQYGIERDPANVLLLVGVRQGPEMQETALPARITATATDLRGVVQPLDLREVRSGGLIDYAGVARVSPPDTLRFDLVIQRESGATSTMQFTRDIFPR
ncbi:DUF4426 domain-containing protein [Lysobacter sp. A3-1-A15]|uniref:DUF4426 domain-containing protein n=1 Tax=Novilysobacter viscosus TaxID=3098602 RepID=UPI002ED8DBB8